MPGTRAERIRWILDELDLVYQVKTIDLFKGEGQRSDYLAIHLLAEQRYAKALNVLEQALRDQDYLVDGQFSAADILIGYMLAWFPEQLVPYPSLQRYLARLQQRPAYPHKRKE